MSDSDEDWTGAERARLEAFPAQDAPPPGLEARVVAALRERGLLRDRRRRVWTLAAAAALAAFVGGVALGRATVGARGRAPASDARSFALLLYPGPGMDERAGAEGRRVEEYRAWAHGLGERGRLVTGQKLKPAVHLLGDPSPGTAPAPVPDGALQGFFLIRARTMEEAEDIARSCPHLRHGGTIALREIDPT
jgi:hypothetical protein